MLRPYQTHCVDTLWNALAAGPRVLCVMATGGGKTECFISLIERANVRTAVLVGRTALVSQTVRRLSGVLPDVGVWSAGYGEKRIAPVTVVSIHSADTLTIEGLRLVVCDEVHNMNDGRYFRFMQRHPGVKLVGLTATPWRDGAEIFGEGQPFPRIHYKRGLKDLIRDGFLVPPIAKAMPTAWSTSALKLQGDDFKLSDLARLTDNSEKIRAQVADALPRLSDRKKVVWMCATIEHAERVATCIGDSVSIVHSKNPNNDYAMECFERGDTRHMVSVMMLSEGYDFPAIDAVVLMRPTRSPTLYVQTCGRSLRPAPGKTDALILDYGEVVKNCGPLHDPFTKVRRLKLEKEKIEITMRVCPKCLSYMEGAICEDCGHEMTVERDPLKNLTREAAIVDLMRERRPELKICDQITASKYKSKNGNDCIKLSFRIGLGSVHSYISAHPFSWRMGSEMLYKLTPFRFESWQECYDNCESLVFECPVDVMVGEENGYPKIKGILDRAPDSDLPF